MKIRTKVVEGEDWMEEWGMIIDVSNMEVELRKLRIWVKCTVYG